MEKKCPFASLWSAGIIVALFSLVAYLTLTRPDTGVISALWTIVATLFKLIPFVIGLAIGIALCVAAVLVIYVASAYIVDCSLGREAFARAKGAVRGQFASFLACVAPSKFGSGCELALAGDAACSTGVLSGGDAFTQIKESPMTAICRKAESGSVGADSGISQILERLQTFDARLLAMESALQALQDKIGNFVMADKFDTLRSTIQGVEANSRQSLEEKTTQIQEHLEKLANQSASFQPLGKSVEDLNARCAALEQLQNTLPKEIAALREEYAGQITEFSQQLAGLKGEVAEQLRSAQNKSKSGGKKKGAPQ